MLKLALDMRLLCKAVPARTFPGHPQLTSPFDYYSHNEAVIKSDFPRLSPHIELLLLAHLRVNHITQETYCQAHHRYPAEENQLMHHPRLACCKAVTEQFRRIYHAFNHLWTLDSRQLWSTLTMDEHLTVTRITTYLHDAWNLTSSSFDPHRPVKFPFFQQR
eukprot:5104442-Amphidinium_carterae.1